MKIRKRMIGVGILLSVFMMITVYSDVAYAAASFSVSGGGTVSAGESKTITITTTECGGEFTLSVSGGGSISGSSIYSGNKIFVDGTSTFTLTASSSGSTTVTVTASDVVDLYREYVTGSKTATLTVQTTTSSSTDSSTTTTTPTVTESSNSNLTALSIDEGEIDPEFYYGTTSYTATVYDVDTVTVNATKEHSAATIVSGTG